MTPTLSLLLLLVVPSFVIGAALPTWPNPTTDELEDIMFLNTGHRAKLFSKPVTPCSFSAQGPGRIAAAEWLRTSFHDAAASNTYFGVGGLDASIIYELTKGYDIGSAFPTTLTTYEPFFGPRTSFADIIAMGTYTSVRACGGPSIPIRPGRVDATTYASYLAVPQPQDTIDAFNNEFARMGMSQTQMIQAVACGHTIGGVHTANFPLIAPTGKFPNDYGPMDSSDAVFDNHIATEYVAGNSSDPLASGACQANQQCSDKVVFDSDGGATIKTMTDPTAFQSICQNILQTMIEVVPKGVTLGNALTPYEVKPYALQLYLSSSSSLTFAGEIRVRTTNRPASAIKSVQLVYKDRSGGSNCNGCTVSTTDAGSAAGFDDSFEFYGFSTTLPISSSISSFTILITHIDGSTETFDNNGASFPIQDTLLFQSPQSCSASSSSMIISAAVRNTTTDAPNLNVIGRNYGGKYIKPTLNTTTTALSASANVGSYQLYNLTIPLNSTQANTVRFNVTLGTLTAAIDLPSYTDLSTTCSPISAASASSTTTSSATTTTSIISTTSSIFTSAANSTSSTSVSSTTSSTISSTTSTTAVSSTISTTTSSAPTSTPTLNATYLGCYTDSVQSRTLTTSFTYDSTSMTPALCSAFCSTTQYFGLEYTGECYCGNSLQNDATNTIGQGCTMPCAGDASSICGGSNRLSLYSNNDYAAAKTESYDGYSYVACYTDTVSNRTLSSARQNNNALTIQQCADFCDAAGYDYMGTEYSSECYCANSIGGGATVAPGGEGDCGMVCSGDAGSACGGSNRISLYSKSGKVAGRRAKREEHLRRHGRKYSALSAVGNLR